MTPAVGKLLADARIGKNGHHALVGMFRRSVLGRPAGYEDVKDALRLRHDPAMRLIIGGKEAKYLGASPPDGLIRNELAGNARVPRDGRRTLRSLDRLGYEKSSARSRRTRHGFISQPSAWRSR